ncbi:CDF family Co(II)/Ni(II) efflux transporter DmeF [Xenophilus sp. Marseille-Q4582]|uniref:CDF family Co(II)/Ni(II) efflux transporter DmeF n=1 Tax=Xenophilus sp. Marseille-Q4582 TaxID=2866600 RepID=UPI001CE49FA2|nr:CDF family Co(II)/Ni(II) efflux transporter DmeF [Xenophilus sp. Marseille-Q4582]
MHTSDLRPWQHSHQFDTGNASAERSTRVVLAITAVAMLVEIGAGAWFNSMALLADGWHMSSHAVAIGLSAFAYAAARRYARDPRFAFGTWKIEVLGGFASALFLLGVAALMVVGSLERLWSPAPIHYREAIVVAVLGLVVNLACARLLHAGHGHEHGHDHHHGHGHAHGHGHDDHHHDLNLRSAYLHVVADAATSVLAIGALLGGWFFGWAWLDPAMGLVGAALVALWARGLLQETAKVLLDREMDHPVTDEIREGIETALADSETRVADLHVWRVGRAAYACAVTVVTHSPTLTADQVRATFAMHEEIRHSTVEIQRCG